VNLQSVDFSAKLGREDSFHPTIRNDSLRQDSNDNGVRIVNFAASNNSVANSTMFPHRNIHEYAWTSPDGKIHNQIDHILIGRRWHSNTLDARSFRGADCDTDHYLVVAELRAKLAASKHSTQKFDEGSFNLRTLSGLEVMKQYKTEISKTSAALQNLNDSEDINRAWENIKDNIRTSTKRFCICIN
jgi:hypothetical protein